MFRKFLSFVLAGLLINAASAAPVFADTQQEKAARMTQKVRDAILKIGTGVNARVAVKLQNKAKLKGYVHQAGEENFLIVDVKTGEATTVAYSEVKQMKGENRSAGRRVSVGGRNPWSLREALIGAAVVGAVIAVPILILVSVDPNKT